MVSTSRHDGKLQEEQKHLERNMIDHEDAVFGKSPKQHIDHITVPFDNPPNDSRPLSCVACGQPSGLFPP